MTVRRLLATFYQQATPATTYWRCTVPARHLPGKVSQELTAAQNPDGTFEFHEHEGGAAVWQFPGSQDRAWAAVSLQAAGIRTLVEVDDNYLIDDPLIQRRAGWKPRIGQGPHSAQGHRWIVRHADGVIAATPVLADLYSALNENVFVCPNAIDPADWPRYEKPDDGVFRVGWFASMSHDRDEPLVRRALSWASRQPGVEVVTMGFNPPSFRHTQLPWAPISEYWRQMMRLDVGVAPIIRTGWSSCRSDLKALEYGMAGVLPIVSAEPPYIGWDKRPALVAYTAKDFEEHVRWCVNHRDEARALAAKTRAYVLAERTIDKWVGCWRDAIQPAVDGEVAVAS